VGWFDHGNASLDIELADIIKRSASNHNCIMHQLENIIHAALNVGDNNQLRAQAEAQIYQIAKENYTGFFLTLANIIAD
jgi:hypothetical protein